MNFFILDTLAAINESSQSSSFSIILMLIIFSLIFYLLILLPQQKQAKDHKKLLNSISEGDEILTTGGLIGRVVKVINISYISVALNDTNKVIIKRDFITTVLPKGTIKSL